MSKKTTGAATSAATTKKYNVAHSKKLGRYMVAAKKLSAGEVIFREDALAVGPTPADQQEDAAASYNVFCYACMRPLPNYHVAKTRYNCSKCSAAPLCSPVCETSVGLHSARECKVLEERKELLHQSSIEELTQILLHLRLWLTSRESDTTDIWEKLGSMEAHLDERRNTPVWEDREKNVVEVFRRLGLYPASTSSSTIAEIDEQLQWLCGIVDVNTFELRVPLPPTCLDFTTTIPLLRGLYLEAALMAHECRASAHVAVDDCFRMTVYASRAIEEGESITFNYTSSLLGTMERQEHLQLGKYFRCECDACADPIEQGSYLSCIICPRCRRDYIAIRDTGERDPYGKRAEWQCRRCEKVYAGCLIRSTIDVGETMIGRIDEASYKAIEHLLDKLSLTFHDNHFLMLSLKQKLLAAYREEMTNLNPPRKILQKMLDLSKEVLDVLEIVEPGISRLKGIILYEMHLPIANLANRAYAAREITSKQLVARLEEAQRHLRRALTMLLLEPQSTPEGLLAKRALQEMRMLAQNIEDAKALPDVEESAKQQRSCRHGRNNRMRIR